MWISAVSARLEGWQVLSERAKRELVHDSQTRLSDVLDGRHRGADRLEPRLLIRRRGEIAFDPTQRAEAQMVGLSWATLLLPLLCRGLRATPKTAVIITVHNALPYVRDCLESIEQHTPHGSYKIILVDDHSDASTGTALRTWVAKRKFREKHEYISMRAGSSERAGYTKTVNAGLKAALEDASVDSMLNLNSDTIVSSGWLSRLRAVLTTDTDAHRDDAYAVAERFEFVDLDGDGSIDAHELSRGAFLAQYGSASSSVEHIASAVVPALDRDADGRITWSEICPGAPPISFVRSPEAKSMAPRCVARGLPEESTAAHASALGRAGLLRREVGAVGAISNAAGYQSVPFRTMSEAGGSRYSPSGKPVASDAGAWAAVNMPDGWTPVTAARAAHLGSPPHPSSNAAAAPLAGLLNGFLILVPRTVLERVGLMDELTYPYGYGEENVRLPETDARPTLNPFCPVFVRIFAYAFEPRATSFVSHSTCTCSMPSPNRTPWRIVVASRISRARGMNGNGEEARF